MDNKEFREAVYKKYEYYRKYKNTKNNSFFYTPQYNTSIIHRKIPFTYAASFLIICLVITGFAYATSQYTQNKNIWKEPETYNYTGDNEITKNELQETISKEEANKIAINLLQQLNIEPGNITSSELNKLAFEDKIKWIIKTDKNLDVEIDAKTGAIDTFNNNNLFQATRRSSTEYEAIQVANEITKEICEKLSYEKKYELSYISSMGNGQWSADFSVKYNGIFNDYQTIRFMFFPSTKEIILLKIFDYEFENNPYEISEEKAIEIAKQKYGANNIQEISTKKDIKMMNSISYLKDHTPPEGQFYRTEEIVRNIWNTEIIDKYTGNSEIYYIDATTGEIIGGKEKIANN